MDFEYKKRHLNPIDNQQLINSSDKKKSSYLFKIKLILCVIVIFVLITSIYITFCLDFNPMNSVRKIITTPINFKMNSSKIKLDKKYLINLPGCRIAFMKPYDPSILQFVGPPEEFHCSEDYPTFSKKIDSNQIEIDQKVLKKFNYNITKGGCYYREFKRRIPVNDDRDNKVEFIEDYIPFENVNGTLKTTKITQKEFIQVMCNKSDGKIFHKDYYYFIPKDRVAGKKKMFEDSKDYLNIFLTGIDAVSRLNLHRLLPKTVEYVLSELDAEEMIGYNKIGDNTFPNLMAVLTGQTDDQIINGCVAHSKYNRFDNCSLIWKNFSQKGYVTAFAEDATSMGLFDYLRKGFEHTTTDYDYRAFDRFTNDEIGNTELANANLCLGKRIRPNVLLSYQREFLKTFQDHPFFGLFWSVSMSHDLLNLPGVLDKFYFNFFRDLKTQKLINKTAVLFMSDHGMRWGSIRSTYQGRIEERLPYLFFIMPKWFREKYSLAWRNLQINTKRLTTPFDLHQTLVDLENLDSITNEKILKRTNLLSNQTLKRGLSLFLPIFPERTCELAHIDDHWCACQRFKEIDIGTPVVQNISEFVVNEINAQLEGYRGCAKLKLGEIQSASIADVDHLNNENEKKAVIEEYTVVFVTKPGDGNFEATVQVTDDGKNRFKLSGSISRINLYGEQSRCITDFHLKLYCYCL